MEKFAYTDGEKFGIFDGEKSETFESEYILRYKQYAETRVKNDEWKYGGEGARYRGDYDVYKNRAEKITAYINGVQIEGEKTVYAFTVNGSSGVYRKNTGNFKDPEEHVYSSSDGEILSVQGGGKEYAVTVRDGAVTSKIGTLSPANSELKTLTDGDSRDQNPSFSTVNPEIIYFDSAGVGRDINGNFTGKYAPASIYSINTVTLDIQEVFGDGKNSYTRPKQAKDGTLYCIQRPNKEKRGGNPLLEILMIPVRIVQALVMFVQFFVTIFTGKGLTSETSGGANPAKGRDADRKKLYVDGNLIEAEKELKRNKKFKDREYGFIPMSWKLVKLENGKAVPIESGVCDFALCSDGGIYTTNGKHVYLRKDGKSRKVLDTDMCLNLSTACERESSEDMFFG